MRWFMAAALSLVAYLAMARSVVAPVVTGPARLEYLFLAPSLTELLLLAAGAVALTLALRLFAIGVAARGGDAVRAREGRWMSPLCLLALSLLPLAVFIPGLSTFGAPFVFVGHDLRVWLLLVALALLVRELDAISGAHLRRRLAKPSAWSAPFRLLAWDAAIFSAVIVWAVLTTPVMRFTGDPHGDEPKYLRYAENWYQGNGFDLRSKALMSDMPIDAPSRVTRNVALAAGAALEDVPALAGDLRAFAASPWSFRWNRAQAGDNWFLTGKRGGLYQVHTPGLSAVMFPGYFLDRHFLDLKSGHQGEVPGGLLMTNLTLLLLYAVWAVMIFRLLRQLFGSDRLAAALAVLAMVTLPVTSFAFQLYPETAAGIALTASLMFLLFPRPGAGAMRALAFGVLCGFLPWAHIRFSLVSVSFVAYALLPRAGEWRQRRMFLAGYAAMVALMCVYAYRLTGSAMPNAMFSAEGTADPFDASLIGPYFIGYMVDRIWGILPHVPVYLLAFLGLGALWRSNRGHAVLFAAIYLSLAIPSAAHSLNAAGATPGRHLVAVLPLAAWPLGLALRTWWSSRWFRAAFATLTLVSLQAALAYNWWHTKDTGRMWDVSISGWKMNLLFPWTHGDVWAASRGNFILFVIGVTALVALIVAGFVRRSTRPADALGVRVTASMLASGLMAIALAGVGAASLTGDGFREDYMQHPLLSRRLALDRLVELDDCTLCAASGRGEVSPAALTWHALEAFNIFIDVDAARTAHVRIFASARGREPAYGHVRIDYGDGSTSPATPVSGFRRVTHTYSAPGTYIVKARLRLPDGKMEETYTEVLVR